MSNEALIQLIGLGQGAMILIAIAGFGWVLKIAADVGSIKATLSYYERQKVDSSKVHEELFTRVREVEREIDKCPNCTNAIIQTPGST